MRAPRPAVPEEMITESNENAAGAMIETCKEGITDRDTVDDTESSVETRTDPKASSEASNDEVNEMADASHQAEHDLGNETAAKMEFRGSKETRYDEGERKPTISKEKENYDHNGRDEHAMEAASLPNM